MILEIRDVCSGRLQLTLRRFGNDRVKQDGGSHNQNTGMMTMMLSIDFSNCKLWICCLKLSCIHVRFPQRSVINFDGHYLIKKRILRITHKLSVTEGHLVVT